MDDQFFSFRDRSIDLLAKKKSRLDKQLIAVIDYLQKEFIEKIGLKNIAINGRVKGTTSLPEKIIRKNYYSKYKDAETFIGELPDILGVRIICLLNSEEKNIYKKLNEIFCYEYKYKQEFLSNNIESDNGLNALFIKKELQPQKQKNGLDIYRITCKWFDKDENEYVNVELQIKSLVHFFWGELEHMLFYKNYSYNIAGDFFQSQMNIIEEDLNIIDYQLTSLKDHLMKNEKAKVQEAKEITALLLSGAYNKCITKYIDCEIDLREIYDIIVDIHYNKNRGNIEIIPRLIDILEKTKDLAVEPGEFFKNPPSIFDKQMDGKGQYIAEQINNCILSGDVFWEMFYFLYRSIRELNDHNETIRDMSKNLMDLFSLFEEDLAEFSDLDTENDKCEVIKNSIYEGIGKVFIEYKKIDFFLYKSHLKNCLILIAQFIDKYNNKINSASYEEVDENKQLLSEYIYILLNSCIKRELLSNELASLYDLAGENNLFDIPIENSELQNLINKESRLSEEKVFSLIGFSLEGV